MTFDGVKAVGEDVGGTRSQWEQGFARFGRVGGAGRELEEAEYKCEADKGEHCAPSNESRTSCHNTSELEHLPCYAAPFLWNSLRYTPARQ